MIITVFSFSQKSKVFWQAFFVKHNLKLLLFLLTAISTVSLIFFSQTGLALAYNDARSHLDIARRVVEGLKPGFAQLGSVWLPLPHILMLPTVWIDLFWHMGLSGSIVSMISYILTGLLIYLFLKELGVGLLGRWVAVGIFALNINILYLASTAMTESLLIATMTASAYYLLCWYKRGLLIDLIKAAFWVMLSTLTRYDGWFLFLISLFLVMSKIYLKKGVKAVEGTTIFFATLAGFGILLWFLWNQIIFHDALYFAFGPYSAHAQQAQLEKAHNLATKGDLFFSIKVYTYSLFYNVGGLFTVLGFLGSILFWLSKKISWTTKLVTTSLITPLLFNVVALFLGHSVLFIQGLSGNTWFNVRYGIMLIPFISIFIGYLIDQAKTLRLVLIGLLLLVSFFTFKSFDAVTIDDAKVGSSQKNVTEVSSWLNKNAKDQEGFILISAASHDAIIFSSGLKMSRFIHEGTGDYWSLATQSPDRWARWIIMRTYDDNDSTYKLVKSTSGFSRYQLVERYPFADIYQLKDDYLSTLNIKPKKPLL